ncbi:beta-glucosidase family protein [Hamadaea tsunoensis]|uniref:beta-glucosidase family protein n=1 Tax=Hamadaea tsunoensis TaxID=53368 RepID=UPI00040C2AD8|nr:glycoside hydrolase family 3 N-terminal domain-containing protein [Hamadaea tsunoensis]
MLYRDPTRDLGERAEDLLHRMTPEEKAAQLGSAWVFELTGPDGLTTGRMKDGLGQVTRIGGASGARPAEAARTANEIQRFLVEGTRLGVPAMVHEEICSGLMARDNVVFPQAIGVASTWEPVLAERLAASVRRRMRAVGAHQGLSPVLDVCRDPRWGRTEETFGEDPYLVARTGVAFIRGLQGDDLSDGVVATAKHFVGYGASEGGMNWAPAHIGPRELREVYLFPFEAAVRLGGLRSVMNGYHELDGVPCGAHRTLLTGILREEWGFDGIVVSDYFSVRQLHEYHRLAADGVAASALAVSAGLDVELPSTDCFGAELLAAVASGRLSAADFDQAVRRVLRAKFALGLLDRPYVDEDRVTVADPAGRALAREIAEKSLILLANDGTLPLAPGTRIAVVGPNADDRRNLLGDYSYPAHVESLAELGGHRLDPVELTHPTVLDALRDRFDVAYARGCDVNSASTEGFAEAVAAVEGADVAVVVVGDKSGLMDDCTSGEARDRASLDLPGVQELLVRELCATRTPVVLVIVGGRPMGSETLLGQCAAVLMAWLPGEAGAEAVAAAVAGVVNPGGKLPISYPRSVGQLPVYYGHKLSGGRSHWKGDYVDSSTKPLHPFGFGLSYTTFAVSAAVAGAAEVPWDGTVTVGATVTNTGERAGDEVLQLYARRTTASVTRPVLELKNYARVTLAGGESCRVTFELRAGQLGFLGRDMAFAVEPGPVELFVGTSSQALTPAGTIGIVPGKSPAVQEYDGAVTVSAA